MERVYGAASLTTSTANTLKLVPTKHSGQDSLEMLSGLTLPLLSWILAQREGSGLDGEQRPQHKRIAVLHHIRQTAPPGHEVHSIWKVCSLY